MQNRLLHSQQKRSTIRFYFIRISVSTYVACMANSTEVDKQTTIKCIKSVYFSCLSCIDFYFYIYFELFALVHPCDLDNNGGCAQICLKDGDATKCSCREGFVLSENGLACIKRKFT